MLVLFVTGCAGFNKNEVVHNESLPKDAYYMIFTFKNSVQSGQSPSGSGSQFTYSFIKVSSQFGYDLTQAPAREFSSTRDINLGEAYEYAAKRGADYVVVGQVTKWTDRATEWNFKRDFAGLSVAVYDVYSRRLIRSVDIDQHSNNFYSGTPNDFVRSLSKRVAKELYQPKKKRWWH